MKQTIPGLKPIANNKL